MYICCVCKTEKSSDQFYIYRGYREKRCIPCRKDQNSKWQRANLDKKRQHRRKYLYGLTEEEYQNRLIAQNNQCSICGVSFSNDMKPHIDHDHSTGVIRDLICSNCNHTLGFSEESIERLQATIEYIRRHK